mgnify:CR=1 FL=1
MRHLLYHELLDALDGSACPVCTLAARAVDGFLRSFLYEGVNDVGLRARLRTAGGFCHPHAWQLQRLGDPLAHALLYQDLVDDRLSRPGAFAPSPAPGPDRCPACGLAADAAHRYLSGLVEALADPAFRARYEGAFGLCLPHLARALDLPRLPGPVRDFLLDCARRQGQRLREQLAEIIRKSDYRHAHEPRGPEKDAWVRAVRWWVGGRDLPPTRPGS